MTTCGHRYLDHPDGLACTSPADHQHGHTYQSSAASDLGEGGHRAKESDDQ